MIDDGGESSVNRGNNDFGGVDNDHEDFPDKDPEPSDVKEFNDTLKLDKNSGTPNTKSEEDSANIEDAVQEITLKQELADASLKAAKYGNSFKSGGIKEVVKDVVVDVFKGAKEYIESQDAVLEKIVRNNSKMADEQLESDIENCNELDSPQERINCWNDAYETHLDRIENEVIPYIR